MLIAWENLADDAVVNTDSELATLPSSNVQHPHLAQKWYTAVGVKTAYLIFDMVSSVACSVLAVLGANLTSTGTYRLRASDSDSTVTSNLLYDSGSVSTGIKEGYGAIYRVFDAVTARYWRLDFDDSTVDLNLKIGRVFLGPSWQPSYSQAMGWSITPGDPSIRTRVWGGQVLMDERTQYRVARFTLEFMDEAEMYGNAFALQRANGIVRDVLVIHDINGTYLSEQAIFGQLQASEPLTNYVLNLYRQRFTIEERL